MYAITGITGQVGGVVARTLLAAGKSVRAVVRDTVKGAAWARQGCEVARASMDDANALRAAFAGTQGVFLLLPPNFDPSPGFPESRHMIAAVREALESARPARLVALSTVGAHAERENLLTQLSLMEQALGTLPLPVTFLRPAWFMENAACDLPPARDTGLIPSFLQPLDRKFPMVATADVGRVAAELLQESRKDGPIVELEGPRHISPNDIAASYAELLGRAVSARAVPRDIWETQFRSQGMNNPTPRMRMLDGFNEGWIGFEHDALEGRVELQTVLRGIVERAS
jgi:uncharacterized protein YbjT (DUF2867 family)